MKQNKKEEFNPKNERIKYSYRKHERRVKRKDEKTLLAALKHIRVYESYEDFTGFEGFNDSVADKYICWLFEQNYSLSFINDNIRALKEFLSWLERQKGYRSKINYNHIDYLNVSNNQRKTAKSPEYKKSYSFEQIIKTTRQMPDKSLIEKRNKAIISLQALCGLRVSELRTVKMKNLLAEDDKYFIYVNPKDMEVKTAKTRHANFMPLPQDIVENLLNWYEFLQSEGFKDKDPLFPAIPSKFNQYNMLEVVLKAEAIKSNTTIRDIFRKAFEEVGFEYLRPHSFRHTIVRFATKRSPAFLNAVRQSLGHSSIDTTFNSYGQLSEYDQRKQISEERFDFNN